MRRYTITKKAFTDWLINDQEDIRYWGNRFIKELVRTGRVAATVEQLFHERDSLPGHLFEGQFKEGFEDMIDEEIHIGLINLTDNEK